MKGSSWCRRLVVFTAVWLTVVHNGTSYFSKKGKGLVWRPQTDGEDQGVSFSWQSSWVVIFASADVNTTSVTAHLPIGGNRTYYIELSNPTDEDSQVQIVLEGYPGIGTSPQRPTLQADTFTSEGSRTLPVTGFIAPNLGILPQSLSEDREAVRRRMQEEHGVGVTEGANSLGPDSGWPMARLIVQVDMESHRLPDFVDSLTRFAEASVPGTMKSGNAKHIIVDTHQMDHASMQFKEDMARVCGLSSRTEIIKENLQTMIAFGHLGFCIMEFPNNHKMWKMMYEVRELPLEEGMIFLEPDSPVHLSEVLPDDPRFIEQWALRNRDALRGSGSVDIRATDGWERETGARMEARFSGGGEARRGTVIGVVDTGVDHSHPDLRTRMWTNEKELLGKEGVDDDGNGYVDDIYGYDFNANSGNPMDDHGHGTHCAGIIAAEPNNGVGISGIHWGAKVMALKFLTTNANPNFPPLGRMSDVVRAMTYALDMDVNVLSNSIGTSIPSPSLNMVVQRAASKNVLFIAAAGNTATDNDIEPVYPASFPYSHVLSVAAIGRRGQLTSFSNFGARSVAVAAPGEDILSTVPNGGYELMNGTSQAAPLVAGLAGMILLSGGEKLDLQSYELAELIRRSSRKLRTLEGRMAGGLIDVDGALQSVLEFGEARRRINYFPGGAQTILARQTVTIPVTVNALDQEEYSATLRLSLESKNNRAEDNTDYIPFRIIATVADSHTGPTADGSEPSDSIGAMDTPSSAPQLLSAGAEGPGIDDIAEELLEPPELSESSRAPLQVPPSLTASPPNDSALPAVDIPLDTPATGAAVPPYEELSRNAPTSLDMTEEISTTPAAGPGTVYAAPADSSPVDAEQSHTPPSRTGGDAVSPSIPAPAEPAYSALDASQSSSVESVEPEFPPSLAGGYVADPSLPVPAGPTTSGSSQYYPVEVEQPPSRAAAYGAAAPSIFDYSNAGPSSSAPAGTGPAASPAVTWQPYSNAGTFSVYSDPNRSFGTQSSYSDVPLYSSSYPLHNSYTPHSYPLHNSYNPLYSNSNVLHNTYTPLYSNSNTLHKPLYSNSNTLHNSYNPLYSNSNTLHNSYNPLYSNSDPLHNSYNPLYSNSDPLHNSYNPLYSNSDPIHNSYNPLYSNSDPFHNSYNPLYSNSYQLHDKSHH